MSNDIPKFEIRTSELDQYGMNRDRFLYFLMVLEMKEIISSHLQEIDGKTERVWTRHK